MVIVHPAPRSAKLVEEKHLHLNLPAHHVSEVRLLTSTSKILSLRMVDVLMHAQMANSVMEVSVDGAN